MTQEREAAIKPFHISIDAVNGGWVGRQALGGGFAYSFDRSNEHVFTDISEACSWVRECLLAHHRSGLDEHGYPKKETIP